jgi:hypothetical protein
MSKPSNRRLKKQLSKQRKKLVKQDELKKRRRYHELYPVFEFENDDAVPPEWIELVRTHVNQIRFDDPNSFNSSDRDLFKQVKRFGAERALFDFEAKVPEDQKHLAAAYFAMKLGNVLFTHIPRDRLLNFIPFCDVIVAPRGTHIVVRTRALLKAKGSGGTVYYSKHQPTIEINHKQKIVGFSTHAVRDKHDRCDRHTPGWDRYSGLGDAFGYYNDCVYYEKASLSDNQLAFTVYGKCVPGFVSSRFVIEILGKPCERDARYYHRAGYFPAVIEGDFIKALTFLLPGYSQTPEYQLIESADLSESVKQRMKQQAREMNMHYPQTTGDFSLLKWFHENGVPQIIETDMTIFESPSS